MEKQYNPQQAEPHLQEQWKERNIYKAQNNPGPLFSIDTPPPTVSGSLHIGHVFSYTHTDIAARFKRMDGFSVFYPFGFDDNGLATERFVEKKLDIRAHELSRSEFIKVCLEQTHEAEQQFKRLWQRLGFSVDWDLNYSTISPIAQKISQESFIRLYEKGYAYRRYEPALYCAACRTSVAQAELDDAEQETNFNDIIFTLSDGTFLTVATTRPEFLPACVALFYHPTDERYVRYAGQKAKVPLFDLWVELIPEETVDPQKGTGLVMCCVFGDKQDVEWVKKLNIPYQDHQILGLNGRMNQRAGVFEGLTVMEARQKMILLLGESKLLVSRKPITNRVNVHERCKKPIEYVALSQWFIKILPYKKELLDFAEKVEWHPSFMKSRFTNWVESLGWDWCISRQRFYGIPFPVWHCVDGGHLIMPSVEQLPVDPRETSLFAACPECRSTNLVADSDVMDTWNTSSLTPQICFSLFDPHSSPFDSEAVEQFLPMSIRPQAHDIIRTWAFDTLVKAWMHYGDRLPWKEIVISGHVLSDTKDKLSKSKDNSKMAPEKLLELYSADAIRYWTASARLGHDVAFSENQLKIGSKLSTKLWNAFRFIQEHAQVDEQELPSEPGLLNEWVLDAYNRTLSVYYQSMNSYEVGIALQHAEHFFWSIFCDNYLELVKDQLFNPEKYVPAHVVATRITLGRVGLGILQFFAPYLVHITEALYQEIFYKAGMPLSIHQTRWSKEKIFYPVAQESMAVILEIVQQGRRLKTEQQLSLKTPLLELALGNVEDVDRVVIEKMTEVIRGTLHATTILFIPKNDIASTLRQTEAGVFMEIVLKK